MYVGMYKTSFCGFGFIFDSRSVSPHLLIRGFAQRIGHDAAERSKEASEHDAQVASHFRYCLILKHGDGAAWLVKRKPQAPVLSLPKTYLPCSSAINGLHLCKTTIHKQFRSRDVATVVGCEKHHGLGDLVWCAEPAERSAVGKHLQALLARPCGIRQVLQPGRLDGPRTHRVHANAAILQVRGPCPRERTHGGFCGAINTIRREPFTGDDGRVQDDRGAIRQKRERLLHREKQALHIYVEDRVIVLLSYRTQGGILRNTGIREHDIELALLPLDLREEPIKIAKLRYVSLYAGYISPNLLYCRSQLLLTASRDEHVRAFVHELLRRRQANAAIATSNECNFSFKLTHLFLLCRQVSCSPHQ